MGVIALRPHPAWTVCLLFLFATSPAPAQPEAQKSVRDLIRELESRDEQSRFQALTALEGRGAAALPALDRLLALLEVGDEGTRLRCSLVLGNLGEPAVRPLAERLAHKEAGVVNYALWALEKIGPDA